MRDEKLFVTGGAGFMRLALEELPGCRVVNFDAPTCASDLDNLEGPDERRHASRAATSATARP